MKKMIFTLSVLATATVFATESIDFSAEGTALRPLLHSTCFNANVKDHNEGQEPYLTNGGFASSETILWSEGDFNQRVTDLHHIFPLVGQDPNDAANYFFAASDRKLFYANRCNLDVMYRLGSSKECVGYNSHTLVPTNFSNTANVMSHIISHYQGTFANGVDYSSRISRWEIWSGPDDPDCWWAPNKTPAELRTLFAEFFVTCLKQIKTDHPGVKVGGPALSKWDPDYMGAILDACDAEGVYPDFISYQCYTNSVDGLLAQPAEIRAWLDARGEHYANCEIILSAWHYLPDAEGVGTLTDLDMDKVHQASFGEGGTMTATAAAFNLAVLSGLQDTPLARAYHGASTAFSAFSPFHWSTYNTKTPHVAANAFKLFGTVTKDYTKVLSVQNDGAQSVIAVANAAGTKGALLVTDSSAAAGTVSVPLTGLASVSGLTTKGVNSSSTDIQTLSSGVTLATTSATITKQAGPQAYLLTFNTVTGDEPEPTGNTYYFVGADASGTSSFSGSTAGAVKGWATSQGGTPVQLNSLSAEDTFILTGTDAMNTLRAPGSDNPTFPGGTLMLNGGWLALPGNSQTVTVNNLVANGGGIVHFSTGATMTLAGNVTVGTDGFKLYVNAGGNSRNLVVASKVMGSGPISFLGSTSSDSLAEYIELSGDMSEWTGTITDNASLSSHMKQLTLKLTSSFGGTITALPAGTVAVVVNYAGLPSGKGLRVATTSIPSVLKTGLSFTGITDASAENLPLLTFPAGTVVDATQFTLKSGSTALTDLGTVENADGSITLVANKPSPPPSAIEIPTGANLTYNGQQQTGVASGVGYTLSGTFTATAVGNYTATATLDNPQETKWTDETTAAKTINWSITKATNGWKTEPSLSKTSWPVNKSPATLNVGAANFGTMTATLNDAPFDLENPVFPTVEGEYTLVITVAGSSDYGELVKEITFTITEAVDSATYYLVGQDGGGASSFFSSSNPGTVGWAETEGGAAITHEVAAGNNYMIPAGTVMRTAPNDNADTFLGDTLKLAGEIWFKKAGNTASPVKVLSIPKLIADGGTLNNEKNDINAFEIQGGLEIPEGKTLTVLNQGDTTASRVRNFKISSTTTGSGTLYVSLGGGSTSGTSSKLEISGDWSEFTGQIAAASGKTKLASWTFIISGAFGGAIGEMPDRSSNPNYIINLADNPDGIRIAGTGDALPTCLRYRTCFYGADFANGTDINLLRVPKSVRAALTSKLEFKWAGSYADAVKGMQTGSPSPTAIDESKISFVDNRDGTETYVYNRTTFYQKLANDTRKVTSSDYATGGDYIYQVGEKEYIHVFKDSGTFTPNKDLTDVQVLVVGGGGSGGYGSGGGGGAGGLAYRTDASFASGTGYAVTIGAGGAKKTSSGSGNNGGVSSIGDITAAGGGGGAGKNSAGVAGGSGGGGSGEGKGGGAGTTDLGSAGGAGGVASGHPIGGGGGGADQLGWAAGTQGPSQEESIWNGGCGGDGRDIGSLILGYAQYFAGGGGGGTAGGVKRAGAGGLGGGGRGGYDLNNATYQTPGEDGLGGGGGGGAVDWGSTDGKDHNGAKGGSGIVIVRYMVPVDAKITGTITMSGWKEDETPSEPDLTGLTVTPEEAAPTLLVKYYADAECTQALDAKPILAGTYYVRAEIEKTRQYTAAVSEKTEFTIEAGEKIVVPIPTVSSFVYDGTPKTCVEAGDGYTIDSASTVTATGAGNYSVTLKLNDPETSQWSDLTSTDKVIPWSIAQAENEWTTAAAIDKTEWMQTLDEPGKLTAPVAKFGLIVATLDGQDWDGTLPTEIGSHTAKWTVEETANYTGLEVTISFRIKPDFHTNAWKTEPTISKTSWKSTEEPATITPAEASYGNDTMSAKISVDNGPFVDWDGKVPTTKGAYKIQWVVEETESYSQLEKTIEFLIDRRYCPTHPFMYQKEGDTTWKGADTFSAALSGISGSGYLTGTIELCQDITDATVDKIGTLNYRYITLRSNPDDDQIYVWTRLGKQYNDFQIQNGSKLTISNIVLNITANGSNKMVILFELGVSANENGGEAILGAGAVIQGEVSGSLYLAQKGSSFTLDGGTIRNLTAGSNLLPIPPKSFSVKSGTIENCTVNNGAIIPLGNNTLNLSNVTITNNTTTAGAITVGATGVLKVSGDMIVKDNKVGDVEKNIVLQNAANLQMTGALGANASVGVSFGAKDEVFGLFTMTDATRADKLTAAKFFNDAAPAKFKGRVNGDGQLYWRNANGLVIIAK